MMPLFVVTQKKKKKKLALSRMEFASKCLKKREMNCG